MSRRQAQAGRGAQAEGLFAPCGRTRVIGVVNVTPDSFSDGGSYAGHDEAVRAGTAMVAAGADIVDVGGESTRPGAARVDEAEELRRVQPVIARLAAAGVTVSVDTTRSRVAEAALDAGAVLVNDVSGAREPDLLKLVAERGVPYVLMHARGTSAQMARRAVYGDVVSEVAAELSARLDAVAAAGVAVGRVIVDPGIGFAKTPEHNWALLARLGEIAALGRPLLVGTSRKSFLGAVLAAADGTPRPVTDRDDATQATTALLAAAGVWAVRVHAVRPAADAVRVVSAWRRAGAVAATGAAPGSPAAPRSAAASGSAVAPGSPGGLGSAAEPGWSGRGGQAGGHAVIEPGGGCAADRITVTGLRVHGRHGVLAAERELGQEFVIDATVWLDTTPAAATDDVTATVHYGDLAEHLAKIVSGEPVKLIETLAHRLAGACLVHPRVRSAEVTVHKPAAPIPLPFADVAVTVTRRQPQPQPQPQAQAQRQPQAQAQPTGRPTDAGASKTGGAAE